MTFQVKAVFIGPANQQCLLEMNKREKAEDIAKPGVELRFWLRQGKEKRLPARKKDSWQGFNKSAEMSIATKFD